MSDSKINNIPTAAPIFNDASEADLFQIVKHLSSASYHYADDSGKEWTQATNHVNSAADLIIKCKLELGAVRHLHSHQSQLVSLDDLMRRVLTKLYADRAALETAS